MKRRGPFLRLAHAAALLAVALLSFASVKSILMQAAPAPAPWEIITCGAHDLAFAPNGSNQRSDPHKAGFAVCGFCALAAHIPPAVSGAPFAPPLRVAWRAEPALYVSAAPSAPPRAPKARGPPRPRLFA